MIYRLFMVNNEKPRKDNGGERDEDAAMDVWIHEESYLSSERVRGSVKVAPVRKGYKVAQTCQEKGRKARSKKNVRFAGTSKQTERKIENLLERLV